MNEPKTRTSGFHEVIVVPIVDGANPRPVMRFSIPNGTGAKVRDEWPIEKLHAKGKLDDREYYAALWFRDEIERAGVGSASAVNPDKIMVDYNRRSEFTPHWIDRLTEVNEALRAVGKEGASILWFCAGMGESINQWVSRARGSGWNVTHGYATGLLKGVLGTLATYRRL